MSGKSRLPELVVDPSALKQIASELRKSATIGVDTEFIRETTFFPNIALIQLATENSTWLVDPTVFDKEQMQPLLDVLVDPSIVKILHAAFADQECFYWSYGVIAEPVLDTAVAAALCGMGDNAGLGKLLREVLGVNVPKGRARAKWLARPLSEELLSYAEQDVAHLVVLGEKLRQRLQEKGRLEWAVEESLIDATAFDLPPEDMALKMGKNSYADAGQYPILVELVRWREARARKGNLPRNWVADNETLLAIARVRPRSISELKSFRGIHAREVDKNGEAILEAIRTGMRGEVPKFSNPRPAALSEAEEHVVDFIQTYVGYLGARHEIATRYLLTTPGTVRLLRKKNLSPEGWVSEKILSQRASDLIGADLSELLQGRRALVLNNGEVQIVPLPPSLQNT